jgi:hypothetical protein
MHILGRQRRAAVEKLSIGNETPAKEGYVAKTRHTLKAELGEEQPSVIKTMVRPERFELPTYCSGVILGRIGLDWSKV